MKRLLLFVFSWCLSLTLWANGTEVDGIYYIFSTSGSTNTATVTYTGSNTGGTNGYEGAIVIPETVEYEGVTYTVTAIGEYAFHGRTSSYSHVSWVSIPSTVTSIGNYAFQYNDTMEEIVLPNAITSLGNYAFRDCTALITATLPNAIQSIPQYCFYGCSALTTVTYDGAPDDGECFHIPATVNAINDRAFYECSALEGNLTLPSTLNYIDAYAFYRCNGLTSVTVEAADAPLYVENTANYGPFYQCSFETAHLLRNCVNVKGVNNSTTHEYGIFRGVARKDYGGLRTAYIGNAVTILDSGTFYSCDSLAEVIIEEGNALEAVNSSAFRSCASLTSFALPSTVTTIGDHAFYGCSLINGFTLPDGLTTIGQYAFYDCEAWEVANLTIPAGVSAIEQYTFYKCSSLTGTVSLPNDLASLGTYAFDGCSSIEHVAIPDNITAVPNYCFTNCSSLQDPGLHAGITQIGQHAYDGCTSFTEVTIPLACLNIMTYGLASCTNLTKVTFEEGERARMTLGTYLFYSDSLLTDVNLPAEVATIPERLFQYCRSLVEVTIPENVTDINTYAFLGCSSLKELTIPAKVETIQGSVWKDCSSLKKIHLLNPTPVSIADTDFTDDGDMDWPLVIYVPYGSEEAYEASSWGTAIVYSDTYLGKIIFNSSVVTIDSADEEGTYYATYYHPYALDIPDGVAAYAVTAYDGDSGELTLKAVDEGVIPQHSGVLLSRTSDDDISSYRIYIAEDDAHDAISDNMLYGSESSATTNVDGVTDGYYFYGLTTKNSENLGFYWGADDGAAFTMPANKAWLALPATGSGAPRYLSLVAAGADTTGIAAVDASSAADGAIYTLQGVRVSDLSHKGIYIVNGKKVLVK